MVAETGTPAYEAHEGVNSGGANGIYWLRIDGNPDREGRLPVTNLHDIGDRRVRELPSRVEAELVHPLVRGRDVRRWHAEPSAHVLFVQDPEARRGIDERTMVEQYPCALEYLRSFEDELRSRAAYRRYFQHRAREAPLWSMFNVGRYTLAPYKVVWKYQTSEFAAATLHSESGALPLPNDRVILVACADAEEAHFICATLNSTPARCFAACYLVATQVATHPIKYINVPRFDSGNPVHAELARASRDAHEAVALGDQPDEEAVDVAAAKLWALAESDVSTMGSTLDQLLKRDLQQK